MLEGLTAGGAADRLERVRRRALELEAVDAVGVHLTREARSVEANHDDKVGEDENAAFEIITLE